MNPVEHLQNKNTDISEHSWALQWLTTSSPSPWKSQGLPWDVAVQRKRSLEVGVDFMRSEPRLVELSPSAFISR